MSANGEAIQVAIEGNQESFIQERLNFDNMAYKPSICLLKPLIGNCSKWAGNMDSASFNVGEIATGNSKNRLQ